MKKTNILFLSATAAAATAGFGQSGDSKPTYSSAIELPELVVSATRTPTPTTKTAASLATISRADIEANGFTTVADALENVAGLSIVRNGTVGQATSVFTRGTESNHTLLTVDGRRAPSLLAGGFDWANLPLDNIDRIEVVKSSASAVYGGDAIGGVINIITRTGRGLAQPEYETSFEAGSFNTFSETAAVRGADGKIDYALSLSQFNADYPRDNNNYRRSSVRSSLGYEINEQAYADLKASYFQADGGSPGSTAFAAFNSPAGPDNQLNHLKREVFNISPGIEWTPEGPYSTKLYYTFENQWQPSLDGSGAFNLTGTANRLNVASHLVDWQNEYDLSEDWKLTGGTLWQDQAVDRNQGTAGAINANLQTLGIYGQSQWDATAAFSLINALRYDVYSDYDNQFTWRQGATYTFAETGTAMFANIARSAAPPTAQDLYFPFSANPNLLPEESLSFEVGIDQQIISDKLSSSVTFFRHDYDEFIQSDASTAFVPQNIGDTTIDGIEIGVDLDPTANVNLDFAYTYLDTQNDRTGQRLIRRPRHQVTGRIAYNPTAKLTLAATVNYSIDREDGANVQIGDYLLLNAKASYEVTKNVTAWIRGENLLDDKFEYTAGFPALRLGVHGGIGVKF